MWKCKNLSLLFTLFLFSGLSLHSYAGPVCGDGVVAGDEECDTGQDATSLCNNNTDPAGGNGPCMFTICGDNIVQTPNGVGANEECEPPGTASCDAICQTITTTTAPATTTTAPATTTTAPATTTTAPATTTTAPATTTTAPATTTTAPATTTTTQGGGGTTTTTTTAASTSTTAGTTTTTQVSGGGGKDDDLFDFGGGGCTISKTPSAAMDPIWLLLLLAPGFGILRRRLAITRARGRNRF
jgi:hypothetical protein